LKIKKLHKSRRKWTFEQFLIEFFVLFLYIIVLERLNLSLGDD
jgi:hypothetical protein